METARAILQDALRLQAELLDSHYGGHFIDGATPVLWYGRPRPGCWMTIGTNPSRGEFLDRDGHPRTGEDAKFFWKGDQSFATDLEIERAIDLCDTYFESGRATTSWFGKPGGAKLEALLNGMGRSFYRPAFDVVHVDFFKYATATQMGRIREARTMMEQPDSLALLHRTIAFVAPDRLIVLGRDNCRALDGFVTEGVLPDYPGVRYALGWGTSGIPMLGLYMKPSEVFVGLGNGIDANGLHYGAYAKREHLLRIGRALRHVMDDWMAG